MGSNKFYMFVNLYAPGVCSILGFLFSLGMSVYTIFNGSVTKEFYYIALITITLVLVASTILSIVLIRNYDALIKKNNEREVELHERGERIRSLQGQCEIISEKVHNILHESRKRINEIFSEQVMLYDSLITQSVSFEYDQGRLKEIEKSFGIYMRDLLDNTKSIFDSLTSDQCRVCIKIITRKSDGVSQGIGNLLDIYVTTYARDGASLRKSEAVDESLESFPCNANTAFFRILDDNYQESWFISNDLSALAERGEYKNARSDWRKVYNACIVVPIRIKLSYPHSFSVIGFVCVDNFQGGFTRETGVELLSAIGDHTYNLFGSLSSLQESVKKLTIRADN